MDLELGKRRALVTGSTAGIGYAIARGLAAEGAQAQLAISHGLAMELTGTGVTVNAVLPGPTRTENTERLRADRAKAAGKTVAQIEEGFFRDYRPTSILRRFTSAEEVANLAVYLCGAGASATTGAALRADGGVVNQIM